MEQAGLHLEMEARGFEVRMTISKREKDKHQIPPIIWQH